MIDPLVC